MYLRASGDAPQTEIGRILQRRDDVYTWKMSYEAWQTFQDLREKGLFYDVSLVSDEGERFDAHRIVLCACGQYFRALFSGRWKSSEQQTITINGVKSRVLGKIIDFAYTRQILLHSVFETKELLIAGSHFGIEEMTKTCTNYLVAELNFANSLDLWIFAKTYYCEELQSRVLSFILDNFEAIVRASSSGSGKSIHHLDGDHLGQILESDELNVDSERSAIHVILKWLELASPKERNSHLLRLFSSVRLKFLNPSYLSSLLQKYGNVISECGITGYENRTICFVLVAGGGQTKYLSDRIPNLILGKHSSITNHDIVTVWMMWEVKYVPLMRPQRIECQCYVAFQYNFVFF